MVWGTESEEQKVRFTPRAIPEITVSGDEDMPVVGIDRLAPEDTEAPRAARGRLPDFGTSAGREAWRRRVSPRHRRTVRRYFAGEGPTNGK
jgi:hypothetical protein